MIKEEKEKNDIDVVEVKKDKSPLLNKKVTIALVRRNTSALYQDADLGTLASGASKSFMTPLNRDTGSLIDPLTKKERTWLENELGIDLNVHNKRDNFWTTKKAMVILRKTGRKIETANLTLDLSNPHQFILYKIALVNPRVANTWADRYEDKQYEFVIIDGEVEFEDELSYTLIEDDVQDYIRKHKNSKKKLFDLLRMYGVENASKHVNYNSSSEWLYNELKKATRRKSEVKKLHRIISLGEKDISMKVFVADAVTTGLLEKRGFEYRLSGGQKIGNNETDAINYFIDPRNQSVKARFEQGIEDFFEKNK
jgi:hypothetical protein